MCVCQRHSHLVALHVYVAGTFANHVRAVEILITQTAKDDPLKQLQLAAAVNQRLQGVRHLRDKDQEAWSYVRNSLKAFFETLSDRYHGRYPNQVRAAQQAVCSAIANSAPPRKLHVLSEALGVSVERLSEGRRHWSEWISGGRETLMDVRGKARSDGMPEEWIEFAIDVWTNNTRRSERTKDSLRNPNNRCTLCCFCCVHPHFDAQRQWKSCMYVVHVITHHSLMPTHVVCFGM